MKRGSVCLGAVVCLGTRSLLAGTGAWSADSDGAWTNEANWAGGSVAGGYGSTAYFTNAVSARRTVTLDQPVSVEALRFGSPSNNNWRLVGDGPILLDGASKPRLGSTVNQKVEIFTPLAGTNGFVQESLPGDLELDGNNSRLQGLGDIRAYTVIQSMSKAADDAAGLVRSYFPTGGVILGGARLELVGRKNGSAASSAWALTAGSALAQSASLTATASLAPGQAVTGTGVPAGAFVRQILDGSNLVLSAAADQSAISTLTFAAASFRSEQHLQRVRVDGNQTFKVYKNGGSSFTVNVDRVIGTAAWALKEGDGVVSIPGQREHRNTIQLQSGDLTLAPRAVSRQPAPGAAFHVDASQPESLTLGANNKVGEWRDRNGNGISAKMPTSVTNDWPTLLSNELNGKPVIDFGAWGSGKPYLFWYRAGSQLALSNIYAVFWVIGSQNGGGFLLGSGLPDRPHFHRGQNPSGGFSPGVTSSRIWGYDWGTYPGAKMTTFIDGVPSDANAGLSGGYQLISCQITTNCTAGAFAADRLISDRRGGQRLAEVILYERPITEQERIETEEYLTAKWFGDVRWDADGKDPAVTDLNALGTRALNAPDSGSISLGHLSGSGKLTKNGASTLALTDAQDYLGTRALAGGVLKPAAAPIPSEPASNAFFHVDASRTNAFVLDAAGRVLKWQDWRGNGREAAVQSGFSPPALAAGAAGGKAVVDFGALGSMQALQWNHTNDAIKAVFLVFQSLANTASILGSVGASQYQDFYRGANGQLYNSDGSTPSRAVVYGANYVNGWRIEPMVSALPSGLCVISVVPTTDARACAFAMNRTTGAQTGGQRLAEVIVYSRALSEQERRDTEAYLMRKWLNRAAPGYGDGALAVIPNASFSGPALNVEVTGSGAATIGQLTGGGSILKTGSGTLAVGNGQTALAGAIRVSAGSVSAAASDDTAPAALPLFHVDASNTNTMTLVAENGTNFITRWNSLGVASNAAVERATFKRPFLLPGDLGGLPTVGFGPYGTNNACLKWETTVSTIRAAFLVLGSQEGGGFLLGAVGSANFHRGNYNNNFNPITKDNAMFGWDVSANVTGGAVYLDGARLAAPGSQALSGGYQLIEVLTTDNTTADLFAADRVFTDRAGGQRLAEVVVYDRQLTETERKQTEAYLFKKWFGKGAAAAGLGTVAVSDGAGLSAAAAPVAVNRLEGAGTVVKSGSNTLTLIDTTAFTGTVDVASGTLNLAVPAAPVRPPSNTLFWVDASKPGTIDTDAAGNVLAWRDATGNGRSATSLAGRYPTLRGSDFTGRPVVDFGPYGQSSSAGMYWNQQITGMKTIVWLLGSQQSGGYLLGATNATPFHRGPPPDNGQIIATNFSYRNKMLSASWGAIIPTAAYTNGVPVDTQAASLSGGYQTLFMTWNGGTYADGFAFDRTFGDRFGGQRLAEFIVYDRVLTDAERLATDAYLNWKWYGQATAGYARPATQTAVILRSGAALAMSGTEQAVTSLSGSGAVSNGTLVVTGTLSPGLAPGECATLPVSGSLTLAAGAALELDYPRPSHDLVTVSGLLTLAGGGTVSARLPEPPGGGWAGRVPVLTFGAIAGAENLTSWSVAGLPAGFTGALVAEGNTLYLAVFANGTVILLK